MAGDCKCINLTFVCSDEVTTFNFNMTKSGFINNRPFYLGNFDGETYILYFTGAAWVFSNNSDINTYIFVSPATSSNPCNLGGWFAQELTNFNYCDGDFDSPPIIIDEITNEYPDCGLFSGECGCKTVEFSNIDHPNCSLTFQSCDGLIVNQELEYVNEMSLCTYGTPILVNTVDWPNSCGTVIENNNVTCNNFCSSQKLCCISITGKNSNSVEFVINNLSPIGVINGYPYFLFIDSLGTTNKLYYAIDFQGGDAWVIFNDVETGASAKLITPLDFNCPVGNDWSFGPEYFLSLNIQKVECENQPPTPEPPPPCLQGTNECNVITLFELGVKCNTTNAQSLTSSDGTATLTITGGTPPYVVLWDNLNLGQTIINLPPGTYGATVTDYYRDFSARTFCVVSANSTTTTTTTLKPPEPPKQLCFRIDGYISPLSFGLVGLQNGKPFYKTSTIPQYTLSWYPQTPPLIGYWDIVPPPIGSVVTSNNQGFIPTGLWSVLGGPPGPPPLVAVLNVGNCEEPPIFGNNVLKSISEPVEPVQQLSLRIGKNDTICGCEGSIILKAKGGVPPYNYSINNGLTYQNTPIFTNLCNGIYATSVLDDEGTIVSDTITINKPSDPITYFATLNTTFNTVQDNGTILNREYTTTLNITPPLADGVIVTLDIIHSNVFQTSPNLESAENNTTTVLYKNGEDIKPSGMDELSATTFNTIPGCQGETVYINTNSEIWETIEITNTDTITLVTSTVLTRNTLEDCYFASSDESYSILNLKLQGCGCCNIISE